MDADDGGSTDDGESSDDDQGLCPRYYDNAALPSAGSAAHKEGKCKRCCFFPKGRCSNGYDCQFCHFAHEKRKNTQSKKKKSRRRKQRQNPMQALASLASASPNSHNKWPQKSSVQQLVGSAWTPSPQQKTSKLIVHDLQFVPSVSQVDAQCVPTAVMPGHSNAMSMLQMWNRC
jgi:hypothetical protein